MPLRWNIDHAEKFVHIVAEGRVTIAELEAHFDDMVVQKALGYAKLFDASRAEPVYDDHDVLMMGARLSAYTANFDSGPLAVVGEGSLLQTTFKRFVNISPSKRPAAFFKREAEARAWLADRTAAPGP
ncbi:MAG: hypothetical protein JSR90_20350 [Proteobacteria bacterium]|nr:hypothetical protein [Pseudomonadota bacterium]